MLLQRITFKNFKNFFWGLSNFSRILTFRAVWGT